jgi:hypothetical protein
MYATPHDHTRWPDHVQRIEATIAAARTVGPVGTAADLSCGSGAVVKAVDAQQRILGDIAPGFEITGPLEQTLEGLPHVDLYVCTETLEHVDDPDTVLKQIRAKAGALVLSTPVDNWSDPNEEHYWAWSRHDVEGMLADTGWTVDSYSALDFTQHGPWFYCFGIWVCR